MGIRNKLKRLTRQAEADAVLIRLKDGSTRVFDDLTCWEAMFLTKVDLMCDRPIKPSPVLEAVRNAAPESRATFER